MVDKYAKNDARLKAGQKSYLAQFTIKPSYNVDQQSMTTAVNPTPAIDISRAEYFENPVVANLSPRQAENMERKYNLNFEPNASKYDNKILVDNDGNGDVIGVVSPRRRSLNHSENNIKDLDTVDVKFEF